jgi:hypothetical protein
MSLHPLRIAIALLAATVAGPAAWAQTSAASSPSRADVKAETRALEKAGKLEPAGPGGTRAERMAAPPKSTKTRAERKAETVAARKAGTLRPAGSGPTKAELTAPPPTSTKTRAERKAETRAAARARQLTPAGEAPEAPKK